MATPLYIATEPFGPAAGERWARYLDWSGLRHLTELVSLDGMLCPTVLPAEVADEDWPHVVNEDMRLHLFLDLPHLRRRLAGVSRPHRLLCAVLEPDRPPEPPGLGTAFAGHDLVERRTGVSALTNCGGGFPLAFAPGDLNAVGLIADLGRAREVRTTLRAAYPDEPHADCELWALFVLDGG